MPVRTLAESEAASAASFAARAFEALLLTRRTGTAGCFRGVILPLLMLLPPTLLGVLGDESPVPPKPNEALT